ncbi:hypothetical protein AURDEDRAFT_110099 [Auricularia subglabra TFB-10046 SS5]|nr:hypothetical protein AURDEDRAFT_110099 [Auricularia subglabra TFB-10046 SS5]
MSSDAYAGDEKLVFGLDVGTTMSAVSFCHLQVGAHPRVRLVTKWPGQEDAAGDCKLPTLVRYNTKGEPVSYGADALENAAGVEGSLARWFKLHLHPNSVKSAGGTNLEIPPLPEGVPLKQVYAHFLAYLYSHSTAFFRENSHDGASIWERLQDSVEIVLAIPNGWDVVQQGFLRDAIVLAGILPQRHEPRRLQFVSEAEASVHFALQHSDGARWLKPGTNFMVLDAGGSTVDSTLYRCTAVRPKIELEEVTASECVQAGSVFVDRDAEKMLRMKLKESKFGTDEYIHEMMEVFEKKTKRKFDGAPEHYVIAFGRARDNDPGFNISKGRITLTSDEVALAFQGVVYDIHQSFQRVVERADRFCDALLMVGGFSESPYLRKMLRERNAQGGMQIVSIDDGTKKAAAEGATLWYLRQTVVARAVRCYFGTNMTTPYLSYDAKHAERSHTKFTDPDGVVRVGPLFSVWCSKNEIVRGDESRSFEYCRMYPSDTFDPSQLAGFEMQIYACDSDEKPFWLYDSSNIKSPEHVTRGIRPVCKIVGDLSGLRGSMKLHTGSTGERYYKVDYSVEVFFGQTALCAELVWKDNGVTRKGPLTLIPDSVL